MKILVATLALAVAAPALAHEESAFVSAAAHEMAHAHAFGGAAGLPGGALALVAVGLTAAFALSPAFRARVRGVFSRSR